MIHKIVKKGKIEKLSSAEEDLKYWLGRPSEERVAAVDEIRKLEDRSDVRGQYLQIGETYHLN